MGLGTVGVVFAGSVGGASTDSIFFRGSSPFSADSGGSRGDVGVLWISGEGCGESSAIVGGTGLRDVGGGSGANLRPLLAGALCRLPLIGLGLDTT